MIMMRKASTHGGVGKPKATDYVGKGVLRRGGVVPNGPLIKKSGPYKGSTLKGGGKVRVSAGGEKHVVYKAAKNTGKQKKGDIMVNHPTKDKGKWDTINLSRIGRAKTIRQGVASTKKWHRDNPNYQYKGSKKK